GGKGFTGKGTNAPKTPTLKGNKGGKNYTLDRGKNKGKTGYKKPSGANSHKQILAQRILCLEKIGIIILKINMVLEMLSGNLIR
ncbi:hypothetical protein JZO73_14800, partial [Enterococcus plantarum]|uniref:hypothetical protein n=1 Tax=Enterococcus plantarum TaxID=1077675 RepID=UPI001A8D59F9